MNGIEDKSCEFREKETTSQTGKPGISHRKGAVSLGCGRVGKL